MKTILAATDFSPASRNACEYGAALAKAFNARLVLFSAYQQVPVPVTEGPVVVTPEDMRNLAQEQLEAEAKAINMWHTIAVETACDEGVATGSILKAAKDHQADIIVAGMKGSGKAVRRVLGSTATALAGKSAIPLIVVPEEAKYSRIDTIALATESDIEPEKDVHLLDALREIAERFQPKLYLVRITKDRFEEAYEVLNRPAKLIRMVRTLDPVYESIEGKDVPGALNEFVEAYKINMLAMLPQRLSLLERWLTGSTTRSMIFQTHIPLLILPEVKKEK